MLQRQTAVGLGSCLRLFGAVAWAGSEVVLAPGSSDAAVAVAGAAYADPAQHAPGRERVSPAR